MASHFEPIQEKLRTGDYDFLSDQGTHDLYTQKVKLMDSVIRALSKQREEFLSQRESYLAEMALMIAEKVCLRNLSSDREYLVRLVRASIAQVGVSEPIKIRVSVKNADLMGAIREDLKSISHEVNDFHLEASEAVHEYGCEIETDFASLKTSVLDQLRILREAIVRR